jgi:hypothetical protein
MENLENFISFGIFKGIGNIGKIGAKEGGEQIAKKAAKEAVEKAAKEAAEKAAKEAAKKGAKEAVKGGAKEAAEEAAEKAAEKAVKDAGGDELLKAAGKNTGLGKKMTTFMAKHPGKTVGGALAVGLGTYGLSKALESYIGSNDKILNITCSFPSNNDSNDYNECPTDTNYNTNNSKIVIIFSPDVNIVDGDKIIFSDTNFSPNFDGDELEIDTIISSSCIIIEKSNIKTFANTGTFMLKTSMANRMLDQADKGIDTVVSVGGNAVNDLFGGKLNDIISKIKNIGPIICGILCSIICFFIIIKIVFMFIK